MPVHQLVMMKNHTEDLSSQVSTRHTNPRPRNHALSVYTDIVFFGESLPERFMKLAMKVVLLVVKETI